MTGSRAFAALRHRDFRLFWAGLTLSLVGGWMQQVAAPWLVYRLTDSALALGLVAFVAVVPAAPLSLIAGPLLDRLPRRPVLIACQVGLLLPPLSIAVLIWTGHIQVWHVVAAEVVRGVVSTFDQPAKQVAIVDMTGKEDAASAVALWMAAINVAKVVGPAIAGVVVAAVGEGLCFFLNGLSFLAVIGALLAIRLPGAARTERPRSLAGSLADGVRYLTGERLLLAVAVLPLLAGFFVRPFQTLLPVFADDVLAAGARGLGFLNAAAGAGALLGALGAGSVRRGRQWLVAVVVALLLPAATAGFAFSRSFPWACALLVVTGGLLVSVETLAGSLLLTGVRDEFRGRVMSLFSAAAMGLPRVGGLGAGWLAGVLGAPLALSLGALAALVCTGPVAWIIVAAGRRQTRLLAEEQA